MQNYKKGFTLAEVLITLLIIGIIASIVIPAIIQDTQEAEFHTAWKKEYADIAQVVKRMAQENAGTLEGICSDNDSTCFMNAFLPYLNYVKACPSGKNYGNCWYQTSEFKTLSGNTWSVGDNSGIVLSNGMLLMFYYISSTCSQKNGDIYRCGGITVDINGKKGPNSYAKDLFSLHILKNRILPYGTANDDYHCDLNGFGCAATYLYQ